MPTTHGVRRSTVVHRRPRDYYAGGSPRHRSRSERHRSHHEARLTPTAKWYARYRKVFDRGSSGWTASVIAFALGILLLVLPLATGGEAPWASPILQIVVGVLASAWLLTTRRFGDQSGGAAKRVGEANAARGFFLAAASLCVYLTLQQLPLPPRVLAALSPAATALRANTADRIDRMEPSALPATPRHGDVDAIPIADRDRIRQAATTRDGWFPEGWRPFALYPHGAWLELLQYVSYGLVLWLASAVRVPRLLVAAVIAAGACAAGFALVQPMISDQHLLWFLDPDDRQFTTDRLTGPFAGPNELGLFMALVLPVAVGQLVQVWRNYRPGDAVSFGRFTVSAAMVILIGAILAALISSASRAAMMAAALGTLVLCVPWRSPANAPATVATRWSLRLDRLEFRIIAVAAAILVIIVGSALAGYDGRAMLDARLKGFSKGDVAYRAAIVQQALPILRDFPIFGVGLASSTSVLRRYQSYPLVLFPPAHLHNDYLEWLLKVGLLGAALTVVAAFALRRWAQYQPNAPRFLRSGIAGGLVAMSWHVWFDSLLRVPAIAVVAAVLFGLLCNRNWAISEDARSIPSAARPRRGFRWVMQSAIPAALVAGFSILFGVRQLNDLAIQRTIGAGQPVVDLVSADAGTWIGLGDLVSQGSSSDDPAAFECFRKSVRLCPACGDAIGWVAAATTKPAAKLEAIEAAVYLDPTNAGKRVAYAETLEALGRRRDALRQIERAVATDPRPKQYPFLKKPSAEIPGDVVEAVAAGFARAVREHPDRDALVGAASFHEYVGRSREAAALWVRAAEETGNWLGHGTRAVDNAVRAGDYRGAESIGRRIVAHASDQPRAYEVVAMSILRPQKKYVQAERVLDVGTRNTLDSSSLYLALYTLRRERGDIDGAIDALVRGGDRNPGDAEFPYRVGMTYYELKQFGPAELAFGRAVERDPARAEFHYYRGLASEELYDVAGALKAYSRARDLAGSNPTYASAAARIERRLAEASSEVSPVESSEGITRGKTWN